MNLIRREERAAWAHLALRHPLGDAPLPPLEPDASTDARTSYCWALAQAHAQLLENVFGPPPELAAWAFTIAERELYRGDSLAEAQFDVFADYLLGLVYDHTAPEAAAFAARVREEQPLQWPIPD